MKNVCFTLCTLYLLVLFSVFLLFLGTSCDFCLLHNFLLFFISISLLFHPPPPSCAVLLCKFCSLLVLVWLVRVVSLCHLCKDSVHHMQMLLLYFVFLRLFLLDVIIGTGGYWCIGKICFY